MKLLNRSVRNSRTDRGTRRESPRFLPGLSRFSKILDAPILNSRLFLGLIGILLIYAVLSVSYSVTIPLSKASDEYVHFLYSRFLAENKRLPVTGLERKKAGYKSDQPPLYYGLVALVTGGVETDGPPILKMTWDSPRRKLADIVLPRGMIVWTEDEAPPYRGIVLAWFLGRWLSGLLSGLTIGLVYITALTIFPERGHLALGAAAAVAFTPAYLFISAVLNDDNLIGVIVTLFFLGLVWLAQGNRSGRLLVGLGALLGLALITKYSAVILPLELILALILIGRRWKWSKREVATRLGLCLGVAALISGSWFVFVGWHFNEIEELGWLWGVLRPIVAGDASDPTMARLTGETEAAIPTVREPLAAWLTTFFLRFWTTPVFGHTPRFPFLYTGLLMGGICGLSIYGLGRIWHQQKGQDRFWLMLCLLHLIVFMILPVGRYLVSGQIHDTAQARHLLFPAAPAFGLLLVWGLSAWFSERSGVWQYYLVGLILFGLSVAQLRYFTIAFPDRLPVRTVPELAERTARPFSAVFEDGIKLLGYDYHLDTDPARIEVVLYWQSMAYAHEDYLVDLSLLNEQGQTAAQTVAHPAHGRYPMRAWDPGDFIHQTVVLPLSDLPAGRYTLQLRLLGWDEPLLTRSGADRLLLTDLNLSSMRQNRPSSASRLTGEQVELGFNLWQEGTVSDRMPVYRYLADIPVTFYDLPAQTNVQAWLVGPDEERRRAKIAGDDRQTFIVEYDWPSGLYRLEVEVWRETKMLERLTSLPLLQVESRPALYEIPPMDHQLAANFADKISLLGYDLPQRRVDISEGVPLVLYWQARDRIRKSHVIFVRLMDRNQQVWGGYDRLPQEVYSTILWTPGEVVPDGFIVPIEANAPPGIYYLVLGLYYEEEGQPISLPLWQDGSPTETTSLSIGPIKVGRFTNPAQTPQTPLEIRLGQPPVIRLRGYDLAVSGQTATITLHWQALGQTSVDWSIFAHLRDGAGQTIAQQDGPAGSGRYPTSLWDEGEFFQDTLSIPLPDDLPAGHYPLVIGLYNLQDGRRLFVSEAANNEIVLEEISLPPK